MRVLTKDRLDLIEALDAEADLGGVTTALLEKDEHLTDALQAVFALDFECVQLIFCGGTSLSKPHGLIERMSEDADHQDGPDGGRPNAESYETSALSRRRGPGSCGSCTFSAGSGRRG